MTYDQWMNSESDYEAFYGIELTDEERFDAIDAYVESAISHVTAYKEAYGADIE